jgi:hypothetical protein
VAAELGRQTFVASSATIRITRERMLHAEPISTPMMRYIQDLQNISGRWQWLLPVPCRHGANGLQPLPG